MNETEAILCHLRYMNETTIRFYSLWQIIISVSWTTLTSVHWLTKQSWHPSCSDISRTTDTWYYLWGKLFPVLYAERNYLPVVSSRWGTFALWIGLISLHSGVISVSFWRVTILNKCAHELPIITLSSSFSLSLTLLFCSCFCSQQLETLPTCVGTF